jgi:large subunit ribosomal protein L9
MQVVFLKDVPKVGKKYEIKNIADGYALNYLIPRGMARVATSEVVRQIEMEKARKVDELKVHEDLLMKNLKGIDGATVVIKGKANDKGHLFAGLHKAEILPKVLEQTKVQIHPDFIELDKPIKEIGEHIIPVKVKDKAASFKLIVQAE